MTYNDAGESLDGLTSEKLRSFSVEQLAGVLLRLLQQEDAGWQRPDGNRGDLGTLLDFVLNPIWLGRTMRNGHLIGAGGAVIGYAAEEVPDELRERFTEAADLLNRYGLVRQDPSGDSSWSVQPTTEGRAMHVGDNYELTIPRPAEELSRRFGTSIFLLSTKRGADQGHGTCFMLRGGLFITCRHVVEVDDFRIHLDDMEVRRDDLNIRLHAKRDVALLEFKSKRMTRVLDGVRPLEIERFMDSAVAGSQIVAIGYPRIALTQPQRVSAPGSAGGYILDCFNNDYLSVTCQIDDGFSGGPAISAEGRLAGVLTIIPEIRPDTSRASPGLRTLAVATPAKYIWDILPGPPVDRSRPYKVCPLCRSYDLELGYDWDVDVDREGCASGTRVPTVFCKCCGWQTKDL